MENNNQEYLVIVPNIFSNFIKVDASSVEEAKEKAKNILLNQTKDNQVPLNYDFTLPEENWQIVSGEELEKLKSEKID